MIMDEKEELVEIYKEAGRRIQDVRNMRGYTREDLAEKAGISSKFLYEIEIGRKGFSAGNLYYICHALEVRMDYIMFGDVGKNYDQKLMGVLELFENRQTDFLEVALKAIYDLSALK